MKFLYYLSIILTILNCSSKTGTKSIAETGKKVLIVCTSESEFNNKTNGTYLEEIAIPIFEFNQNKIELDILSPKGGVIPIYYNFDTTDVLRQAIESEYYINKISNSKQLKDIKIENYGAILIPGGYGQFNDLHSNNPIKNLIVEHYENGGIIGTIGHGAALISQLKLNDETYLVKDVKMTCFPNWNELNIMDEADKGKLLPFLMEDELLKNGADLKIYNHEKQTNDQIIDLENRIITAAFADGGKFVSNELIKLLKIN